MRKYPDDARQSLDSLDALYKQACEHSDDFSQRMTLVLEKLQGHDPDTFEESSLKIGNVKTWKKAQGNVLGKFGGDASLSCDLLRASYIGKADTIEKAVEEIGNQFEIMAIKDRIARPNKYGYRDNRIQAALPNGHICEIQCLVHEIHDVRDVTHAPRDRANAILKVAETEGRDLTEQERIEYDYLRKFSLGVHNKAAIDCGLNERLDPDLSEAKRMELSIVGFPLVHFKEAAALPTDPALKSDVTIDLGEGLSFTFAEDEDTCDV